MIKVKVKVTISIKIDTKPFNKQYLCYQFHVNGLYLLFGKLNVRDKCFEPIYSILKRNTIFKHVSYHWLKNKLKNYYKHKGMIIPDRTCRIEKKL